MNEESERARNLWTAVLTRAIRDYRELGPKRGKSQKFTRLFREVENYLFKPGSEYLGDCESICAILDLDPAAVRQKIRLAE